MTEKTASTLIGTGSELSLRGWWYGLVVLLGFIGYIRKPEGEGAFIAMTLMLTIFVVAEISNRARLNRSGWFLEPTVWASVFTFGLVYGATNFIYFLPESELAPMGLAPIVTPEMNRLMGLVLIAAAAMWIGFSTGFGEWLGLFLRGLLNPLLRKNLHISPFWTVTFVLLSVFARYEQISYGVFGYTSEYQALLDYAAVREYLDIGASLGAVVLLVLSLVYFDSGRRVILFAVLVLLVYEIALGFLGGFKGRVLLPIVIVGGAALAVRRRFPMWLIPSMVAGLVIAYAVIEPFRDMKTAGSGIEATSIGSISGALNEAATAAIMHDQLDASPDFVPILARSNITAIASLGIAYVDEGANLSADSPSFLADMFLAPLYAVVPRFLWKSKPVQSLGLWYVNEVMGLDAITSVGMGPITYLYFAGGVMAVLIGFAVVGIIQRALFVGLFSAGGGATICYLLLLPTVVLIDSSFNTLFSGIVRYGLIYLLCQWLLLRR